MVFSRMIDKIPLIFHCEEGVRLPAFFRGPDDLYHEVAEWQAIPHWKGDASHTVLRSVLGSALAMTFIDFVKVMVPSPYAIASVWNILHIESRVDVLSAQISLPCHLIT